MADQLAKHQGVFSWNGKICVRVDEEPVLKKSEDGTEDIPATARFTAVISAAGPDLQGDDIDQDGIDWSYFMKSGFFNWEHQPGPDNLLGYPIAGTLKRTKDMEGNDATQVTGELLLHKPKAFHTWQTMVALQKAGNVRQVGFSVEGAVKQRDARNAKKITKSIVRNVAITGAPIRDTARVLTLVKSWDALQDLHKSGEVGYQTPPAMPAPDIANVAPLLKQSIDHRVANKDAIDLDHCLLAVGAQYPTLAYHEKVVLAKSLYAYAQSKRTA